MTYTMSVGRDYRTSSKYEYIIFKGEEVAKREGFFTTSTQAKRAGMKAAQELMANDPQQPLPGL